MNLPIIRQGERLGQGEKRSSPGQLMGQEKQKAPSHRSLEPCHGASQVSGSRYLAVKYSFDATRQLICGEIIPVFSLPKCYPT